MLPREVTEKWEIKWLSPYAAKSLYSKGRKKPEPKCPIRTDFQRDRDRILHSKAFRRLMHKTQVFIAPRGDHYRTRLTHTLEVAQIARTICRALRLNEDLAEAITLGHDLGHPPFGHEGEAALDAAYKEHDPDGSFNHVDQSLRIVETLERDGQGLNLTYEVLDGIAYHSKGMRDWDPRGDDQHLPSTLEGQVVRLADRIAYVNHDIDDAIRAGVLTLEDVPSEIRKVLGETHSARITTLVLNVIESTPPSGPVTLSEPVASALNRLKDFLFEKVYQDSQQVKAETEKCQVVISSLFKYYYHHPNEMPPPFCERARESDKEKARQVCDYIAGMTDRYAIDQFYRLFVPQGWQVA
ncbi:MAG: deoxyguanosinetriphosphate triphosphohydrolase [Armatimonadetes bacterium]|nr:deoxyguanosinetriphosphate triphosphohydrolase [Armatimonadota bacterium]MDW8122744.1 deoxyguanosinetriphosphate triphosphohydrolase [Armatimonadota bacterium]